MRLTFTSKFWIAVSTAMLISFFIAWKDAHADTNLALTCGVYAVRPSTCPNGWMWQKPVQNSMVITQGGSWRTFTLPPNMQDVLTLCASDLKAGSTRASCAKIVYAAGCNANGYQCGAPPDPAEPKKDFLKITWDNNSDDVETNILYRGTRPDGSDLAVYKSLPTFVMYLDQNLTPGTWCYGVKASNKAGDSAMSFPLGCGTIVDTTQRVPGTPANVNVQ